eukprot:9278027-Pyramimonas_sp.AAC.1
MALHLHGIAIALHPFVLHRIALGCTGLPSSILLCRPETQEGEGRRGVGTRGKPRILHPPPSFPWPTDAE